MEIVKDYCPNCNKVTEQIQKKMTYGGDVICRECKTRFASTNPQINRLEDNNN